MKIVNINTVRTVFDMMQRLNSLDRKIDLLREMSDCDGSIVIQNIDREEIIDLLEEYRVFLYEMKVAK